MSSYRPWANSRNSVKRLVNYVTIEGSRTMDTTTNHFEKQHFKLYFTEPPAMQPALVPVLVTSTSIAVETSGKICPLNRTIK